MEVLAVVKAFFRDGRVMTILGLILVDVLLAVSAAIKAGKFDWRRLAEFYRTMVVPYVIGYLAFYLAATFFFDVEWLGDWSSFAGEAVQWVAWSALVGNLVADVMRSGRALGYAFAMEEGGSNE